MLTFKKKIRRQKVKYLGSIKAEFLTSRATEPASVEGLRTVEFFCPTLHLTSGDKKESFAVYVNVGIRRSEIIKRNLIDSGFMYMKGQDVPMANRIEERESIAGRVTCT